MHIHRPGNSLVFVCGGTVSVVTPGRPANVQGTAKVLPKMSEFMAKWLHPVCPVSHEGFTFEQNSISPYSSAAVGYSGFACLLLWFFHQPM